MSVDHECHILHIDDNPHDIELMQLAFDDAEASHAQLMSYVGNTDPVSAVQQLTDGTNRRPSVLMLDLNMPVMDGVQVLERIRQEPDLRAIPVIVFTTSRSPVDRERCLALGATAVICKPSSFQELLVVAKSILTYC